MLGGLAVPVPTLFDAAGGIDRALNARFTRGLCDAGIDHIFVLGSLGEFPGIADAERPVLLESVIESLTRKADAWVGCGAPSTALAVRHAEQAEEMGAEALVIVPPYYLHPTAPAIGRYYRAIRSTTGMPILAYNIPSLVGYALSPTLVHELAREKVIAGIKDTSGSIDSVLGFLSGAPEGFVVLPGDDGLAVDSIRRGAGGAIMGSANVAPRLAVELVREAMAGRFDEARQLQTLTDLLVTVIRAGPFPATVKFLAHRLRGFDVGYRSPYDPLDPEEERATLEALALVEGRLRPYL